MLYFHEFCQFLKETIRILLSAYDLFTFTQAGQGDITRWRVFFGIAMYTMSDNHLLELVLDFVGFEVVMESVQFNHIIKIKVYRNTFKI